MKFGIYSSIANPPRGEGLERCVDEVVEEARLAEESGFDSCFFGEHHQDKDGFLPSPLIMAAIVAGNTKRLNVGTSVLLLPLHHPVKVAEDVTTLDIASRGRAILGVGVGYQPADFQAFGVARKQRASIFEEAIDIIRLCWNGEPFSFHGRHYSLEDVQVLPRPLQRPSPPLWIGASVPAAVRRAGRMGDAFIATANMGRESFDLVHLYREEAIKAGREPRVVLMRDAWCAASHEEAERVYRPEVVKAYSYYAGNQLPGMSTGAGTGADDGDRSLDNVIMGDPEECVQEFHRLQQATGADYFILRLRHAHSGGPPHEQIMKAISLFGEQVIPYCA